jgi:hypothetical protein
VVLLGLLVCLAAVAMVACAAPAGSGTAVPDPSAPGPELPSEDELVPAGVAGAVAWTPLSSMPNDFDVSARYPSPQALADAFVVQLQAGWTGGPIRPSFELDTFSEAEARTVMVITELGVADDSVAGSQYALVIGRRPDGWALDGLWGRALCQREVDRLSQLCV